MVREETGKYALAEAVCLQEDRLITSRNISLFAAVVTAHNVRVHGGARKVCYTGAKPANFTYSIVFLVTVKIKLQIWKFPPTFHTHVAAPLGISPLRYTTQRTQSNPDTKL